MNRPTQYYIGYEDSSRYQQALAHVGGDPDAVELVDIWATEDAKTFRDAKRIAKKRSLERGVTVTVYERVGFVESHPNSEAPGYAEWGWDYVSIGGYTGGRWEKY